MSEWSCVSTCTSLCLARSVSLPPTRILSYILLHACSQSVHKSVDSDVYVVNLVTSKRFGLVDMCERVQKGNRIVGRQEGSLERCYPHDAWGLFPWPYLWCFSEAMVLGIVTVRGWAALDSPIVSFVSVSRLAEATHLPYWYWKVLLWALYVVWS
jgi:hypothetical protein